MAYGVGVTSCRGASALLLTVTSSHRRAPANSPAPKSTETVNSPFATGTLLMATLLPTWFPLTAASNSLNVRLKFPLAGAPPALRDPWYTNAVVCPNVVDAAKPTTIENVTPNLMCNLRIYVKTRQHKTRST